MAFPKIPFNFLLIFKVSRFFLRTKVNFSISRFIRGCFVSLNKHFFTHSSMIDDPQPGNEITAACYTRKVLSLILNLCNFHNGDSYHLSVMNFVTYGGVSAVQR